MAGDRIRRSAWRRTTHPRNWSPYMVRGAASASHNAPKTGGWYAIRHLIAEVRADEAAEMDCGNQILMETTSYE